MIAALALALTLSAPADLTAIHDAVNAEGHVIIEQRHIWAPLSEKGWMGDCKDFALEERKELMALGYAPDRLIIWTAHEGDGPADSPHAHAVLIVDRRWVLDNLVADVEPLGHQTAVLRCAVRDLSPTVRNDNDLERCR